MKFYKVSEELLLKVLENLGKQAYASVVGLVSELQNGVEELKDKVKNEVGDEVKMKRNEK